MEFTTLDEPARLVEAITGDAAEQDGLLRDGDPRNAIVAAWLRFEAQGDSVGLGRRSWETSSEYAIRILDLVSADSGAVNRLAGLYREARFSDHPITEVHRQRGARGAGRDPPEPGGTHMRWGWLSRVGGGVSSRVSWSAAAGSSLAVVLRFDPHPLAYVVMMTIVLTLLWLVLDTVDAPPAQWVPPLPPTADRVDEPTSDLRILSSHAQASVPSSAVRDRLVALARARDPDLAVALRRELDPVRRLSPAEIDRILTRIEETRDRT